MHFNGACVRACEELTGADNLSYLTRGFHHKATTAGDVDYIDSDCVSLRAVCSRMPNRGLTEKSMVGQGRRWDIERS